MADWHVAFQVSVLKFKIGDIDAKARFIQVIEKENLIEVEVIEVYSGHNKISVGQVSKIHYESIYWADGKEMPSLG